MIKSNESSFRPDFDMFWSHSLSVLQCFCRASLWHAFGRLPNLRLRPFFPLNLWRLRVSGAKHGALDAPGHAQRWWQGPRALGWQRGSWNGGDAISCGGVVKNMTGHNTLDKNAGCDDSFWIVNLCAGTIHWEHLQSISGIWGHEMVILDHFSRINEAFFFALDENHIL